MMCSLKNYWGLCFLLIIFFAPGCSNNDNPLPPKEKETEVGEFIDDWTYRVFPSGKNFDIAEFRAWIPEISETPRAILVLLTSSNGNALGLANAPEWRAYAEQEHLALIGVNLASLTSGPYTDAIEGSGDALLTAIKAIAEKHNLSYLEGLPMLFRGYSAGGVFSYSFSGFKPERVIAFANIRGGALPETSDSNAVIPGMFLVGEEELSRVTAMRNVFLSKRALGGLWSFAIEPGADHFDPLEASDFMIKLFFSQALEARLSDNSNVLNPIAEDTGWLGDNFTKDIYSFSQYSGNKSLASWLLSESLATVWKAYNTP